MKGAREYADLFKTGQYGKLYIVSSCHARGKTFQIFILPEGEVEAADRYYPLCNDAVEVYGITGGQLGWTETYGWLYEGKWQQDFQELVKKRRAENATKEIARAGAKAKEQTAHKNKTEALLSNY